MVKDDKMPSEGKVGGNMAQESNQKSSSPIETSILDTAPPIKASEKKDDGERTNPKTVMAAPAELSIASSEVRNYHES